MLDPGPNDLTLGRYDRLDESGYHILLAEELPVAELTASELDTFLEALDTDAVWTESSGCPTMPAEWNDNQRTAVMQLIFDEYADKIREAGREAFVGHGLRFAYAGAGSDLRPTH